jgi:SAM-dependent methyltransferase
LGVVIPTAWDRKTVEGFGHEWARFDQSDPAVLAELQDTFSMYFALFPWDQLPLSAIGLDLGCGSGRWARLVAEKVRTVVCLDPAREALEVAVTNSPRSVFVQSAAGELPFTTGSFDFGYSLGVLHHTPDPLAGLRDAVASLKPGAPFLLYLYYALDNRPVWFRFLWKSTDIVRRIVSRSPRLVRYIFSEVVAAVVYLPLARLAAFLERRGRDVDVLPLSAYRHRSFYTMRTDALDHFGTRMEKRFTRAQVKELMERAGLVDVRISDDVPRWTGVGFKSP